MTLSIANAISYLPPLAHTKADRIESSSTPALRLPFFGSVVETDANKNLTVLFALSSFLSAITPHYAQRYYLTTRDIDVISELCPTFCYFDTLRVVGAKFTTKELRAVLPKFFCLRTLELNETCVNDDAIEEILKVRTLHDFKYKANESALFNARHNNNMGGAFGGGFGILGNNNNNPLNIPNANNNNNNNANANQNDEEGEDEKKPDFITFPYMLRLIDHCDPKVRSSVAFLIATLVLRTDEYLRATEHTTAVERLTREKKKRFEENEKKKMESATTSNEEDLPPATTAAVFRPEDDPELSLYIQAKEDREKQLALGVQGIAPEGGVITRAIFSKIKQRFEKEAGNETISFTNYYFLAVAANLALYRGVMQAVRDQDTEQILRLEAERKKLKEQESRLHSVVWMQQHRVPSRAAKKKKEEEEKKKNEKNEDAAVGTGTDDGQTDSNNDDTNTDTMTSEARELRRVRLSLRELESNFSLPPSASSADYSTSKEKYFIIDQTAWIFHHIEDCLDSRSSSIRQLGYTCLKSATEYFSASFVIAQYGHLFKKAIDRAFAPSTPKSVELITSPPPDTAMLRLDTTQELLDERDRLLNERRKYVFDPHAIKCVGQVVATTIHRSQVTFHSRDPSSETIMMWIIRFFFKTLSFERIMSQLVEYSCEEMQAVLAEKVKKTALFSPLVHQQQQPSTSIKELYDLELDEDTNFFAPFHLDGGTRCIIADVMQLYVPYCISQCIHTQWFFKVIVDLVKRKSSPMMLKTKAVELIRDSLGRYSHSDKISLWSVVRQFEKFGVVDAIFSVLRGLNKDLDPVEWDESQIFVCIAIDCLSMMTFVEPTKELKGFNERSIMMRDALLASAETKEKRKQVLKELKEGVELDAETAKNARLAQRDQQQQQQQQAATAPTATTTAPYVYFHTSVQHFTKQVKETDRIRHSSMTYYSAPFLLGRDQSNTIRLCHKIPDALELLEKVKCLVYAELQDRTFNPIYLALKRSEIPIYDRTKFDKKHQFDESKCRYLTMSMSDDEDDEESEKGKMSNKISGRRRPREQEENIPKKKTTVKRTVSSSKPKPKPKPKAKKPAPKTKPKSKTSTTKTTSKKKKTAKKEMPVKKKVAAKKATATKKKTKVATSSRKPKPKPKAKKTASKKKTVVSKKKK